jgi:hypothetical protein
MLSSGRVVLSQVWNAVGNAREFVRLVAANYCSLNVPEILAEHMIATKSYLQIPRGQCDIFMPLETGVVIEEVVQPRPQEVERYNTKSSVKTSAGMLILDSDRGVLLLGDHGACHEILTHTLLRKKVLRSAMIIKSQGAALQSDVQDGWIVWVELQPTRKQTSLWLLFHQYLKPYLRGRQFQFLHGRMLPMDNPNIDVSCVFLESHPKQILHVSGSSGYRFINLAAPVDAGDVIAYMKVRQQRRKEGHLCPPGSKGSPHVHGPHKCKGRGKGGRPLGQRHPGHTGSCIAGRAAKIFGLRRVVLRW